jgi:hypothetical protein
MLLEHALAHGQAQAAALIKQGQKFTERGWHGGMIGQRIGNEGGRDKELARWGGTTKNSLERRCGGGAT